MLTLPCWKSSRWLCKANPGWAVDPVPTDTVSSMQSTWPIWGLYMHPWDKAVLKRRGRWIGHRSRLSPPIPKHESAGSLFSKLAALKKGICISERSCFALPLIVFSFCLKAGLLHSTAKGAEWRRQEAGASGFDHFFLCLCQPSPLPRGASFKIQRSSKKRGLSRGMQLGCAHTCAHTNTFKGKFGRIHPPGARHLHQPGVGVSHPKWLTLMSSAGGDLKQRAPTERWWLINPSCF